MIGQIQSYDISTNVSVSTLKSLSPTLRLTFFWIYLTFSIFSYISNLIAIGVTIRKEVRALQKTCIIGLALTDIISTTFIALNHLATFNNELLVWDLGEFLCYYVGVGHMFGFIGSFFVVMFIALDRYRSVVKALNKRWNPPPATCIIISFVIALVTFGLSLPMNGFYSFLPVTVNFGHNVLVNMHICACFASQKTKLFTYYIITSVVVFFPLLLVVVWFYYEIAKMIWKHRKPANLRTIYHHETGSSTSASVPSTKTTFKALTKSRDVRTERKIRSFKIVLTITILFILCRLPYIYIFLFKLTYVLNPRLDNDWLKYEYYSLLALYLLNCGMHPFLYAFLNETITLYGQIKEFVVEICCYCCYDFDNFARNNPFMTDEEMKAKFGERKEENKVEKY